MSTLWQMSSSMICGAPNMRHGTMHLHEKKTKLLFCCFESFSRESARFFSFHVSSAIFKVAFQ